MTPTQWQQIPDLAVANITQSFLHMRAQAANERFYGFCLGLVEDLCGFFCAGNTLESLQRVLDDEEDDDSGWFWYISEWAYEGVDDNNAVHHAITALDTETDDDPEQYAQLCRDYEQCLIAALKTCDNNGLFGAERTAGEMVLYLHYADASDETIDNTSSAQLNPPALHQAFLQRWNQNASNSLTDLIRDRLDD